ncbi:MAG: histidinol-phosphate transaminase [Alphaproteobacteria bacterium]
MQDRSASILSLIRPHFHAMEGYISAGMEAQKDESTLFLNANENPYELSGLEGCNRYPEPQPSKLLAKMAAYYGASEDNLLITRGADEGIALLTRLFIEPSKDRILINPPTFGVYKVYARGVPAKDILEIPLLQQNGTFTLDTAAIINSLKKSAPPKLVYITNPNNPTGGSFAQEDILAIIQAAKDKAIVVLDETYAEFEPQGSLVARLKDYPNLVILRTLSKSFSMAGMRVGAILSGVPELIETLKTKIMEVYPIPVACEKAALKVFEPAIMSAAQANIAALISERKRMEEFWSKQTSILHVYPSNANFLLIRMERAANFAKFCKERGVILRDFSNAPLTPDCLRISIGTPEQNERVQTLYLDFIEP